MGEAEILDTILGGGAGVILTLIVVLALGKRGVWVWQRELEQCRKENNRLLAERDEYKDIALQGLLLAEKVAYDE